MFGGTSDIIPPILSDTWTYNIIENEWTLLNPKDKPEARRFHSMSYNSKKNQILLLGGDNGFYGLNDTWIFDLSSSNWVEIVDPKSSVFSQIRYHETVYIPVIEQIFLFGHSRMLVPLFLS